MDSADNPGFGLQFCRSTTILPSVTLSSLRPFTPANLMKKRGFKSWVFKRIKTQLKLTTAAAISMAGVGLILFILQAGFLYIVFRAAYSSTTGILAILALYSVMGIASWRQAEKDLRDRRHKALCNKKDVKLNVAPATSQVWSWAFGSMDPDQSVIEKMMGIAMLVPRLFCAAWYTWQRVDEVRNIDPETTLEVMKILFRSDHSVRPQTIARGLGDVDLNKAIRDVSLLDGVVFLTKDEVTVSVAPRLNEDLEAWRTGGRPETDSEDLFPQ